MKFSYALIKKFVPGVPSKKELVTLFNLRALEAEEADPGVIDVSFTPNRYDAASHWGIARETAAIFRTKLEIPKIRLKYTKKKEKAVSVKIKDLALCPRYNARVFELPKRVKASPKWMQKVLIDCGMRPINPVVDIMNYVMLEVGQPLHAFDWEKLAKQNGVPSIIVRPAHEGEKMTTLDGHEYMLDPSVLLITDPQGPLAIAGIKGGKRAEATEKTRRIVVESASFDYVSIQKTSLHLRLSTDASVRFAHNISSLLTEDGMDRAHELLEEILDARMIDGADVYRKVPGKTIIAFDVERFNALIGVTLSRKEIVESLRLLDFKVVPGPKKIKQKKDDPNVFFVEVPRYRTGIELFEDVAEEAIRIYGYEAVHPTPPFVGLQAPEVEPRIRLSDQLRTIGTSLGFDEVQTYSFLGEKRQYDLGEHIEKRAMELMNPIARDKRYMRASLIPGLLEVCERNKRFFDEVRIFEIGNVFHHGGQELRVGFAVLSDTNEAFLELKGVVEDSIERIGITEVSFVPTEDSLLAIEIDSRIVGYMKRASKQCAVAEIRLDAIIPYITEERAYRPIPKYPAIVRDISLLIPATVRVSDILNAIQTGSHDIIEDVDMLDYFEDPSIGEDKKSLTFRIVFRADDRTLTDDEADKLLKQVSQSIVHAVHAEIR